MKSKQYVQGNVLGAEPSNNLDKLAVEALVARWRNDRWIQCYVHDDDGHTRKVIADSGWTIVEALDSGHKIENWFIIFTTTEVDPEIRFARWQNSSRHSIDNHSECSHGMKPAGSWARTHGEQPEYVEALRGFFRMTSRIMSKVHPGLHE